MITRYLKVTCQPTGHLINHWLRQTPPAPWLDCHVSWESSRRPAHCAWVISNKKMQQTSFESPKGWMLVWQECLIHSQSKCTQQAGWLGTYQSLNRMIGFVLAKGRLKWQLWWVAWKTPVSVQRDPGKRAKPMPTVHICSPVLLIICLSRFMLLDCLRYKLDILIHFSGSECTVEMMRGSGCSWYLRRS